MYDLIGDIHGHADELEGLLLKQGYAEANGVYRHGGKNQRNLVYSAKLYFSSWREAVEASMKSTADEPLAE